MMEFASSDTRLMRPDSPAGVGGIQGAHDFQLNHSSISVVGGDNHTHTHVYYHGTIKDVKAILGAIYNFRKIHQDTLAKVTPGTVKWLFVSQFFKVWWNKSGEIKILWGSGIPGAGKTVLVSLVINEIERRVAEAQEPICVAYFFMRYSEHGQVSVRNVLEVLVKQTVERHQDLLPLAAEVYDQHVREGTEPTEAQLLALLEQFIAHMAITFYILDALDEGPFEIQHALIEKLASLNARLLITSRPMQDVQAYFPEAHCFEIAAHDQDLDLHIAKKLQGNPRLRTLLDRGEASVKQRMISMVKLKSGGM
ncbi:hypothetical protein BKA70DRAFT_1208793 [Coprinopsis sp. MPI-PUGE-AT-0042]|nr:hypothetical protein BKA70DRAFT_1208793 [Coprinopsis sp. MPI-PUGE-AT-0042]